MRKKRNLKAIAAALTCSFVIASPVLAEDNVWEINRMPDSTQDTGTLTINFASEKGGKTVPLGGASISVYQVAQLHTHGGSADFDVLPQYVQTAGEKIDIKDAGDSTALAEKLDKAKIAELSAKVADAAKSQKAADDLGRQIARLLRKGPHRRAFGEVACRGARRHLEGRGAGVHLCGLVQRALRDGAISRMECATGTGLIQSPAESGTRGVRSSAVRSLQRGCQPIAIVAEGSEDFSRRQLRLFRCP